MSCSVHSRQVINLNFKPCIYSFSVSLCCMLNVVLAELDVRMGLLYEI